jgi:hypothetical protein
MKPCPDNQHGRHELHQLRCHHSHWQGKAETPMMLLYLHWRLQSSCPWQNRVAQQSSPQRRSWRKDLPSLWVLPYGEVGLVPQCSHSEHQQPQRHLAPACHLAALQFRYASEQRQPASCLLAGALGDASEELERLAALRYGECLQSQTQML